MARLLFPPILLTIVVVTLWALQRWPHGCWTIGAMVLLLLFGITNIIGAVLIFSRSYMLFGPELRVHLNRLRPYRSASESPLLIIQKWVGYIGATVLAQSLLLEIRWMSVAIGLLGLAMFNWARFIQPPFALLLGASGVDRRDLAKALMFASHPYQVTNLLELEKNRDFIDAYTRQTTTRLVTDALSWPRAVREIAIVAKIVVVDARVLSDAVRAEIVLLSEAAVWYKTLIVVDDHVDNELSVVFDDRQRPPGVLMIREDELYRVVKRLAVAPALLPTPDRPAAALTHTSA